jgi:hypothetical protein
MRRKCQGNGAFQCFGHISCVPEVLALEWRLKFLSAGFLSAVAHMSKAHGISYLVEQFRFHHEQNSSVVRLLQMCPVCVVFISSLSTWFIFPDSDHLKCTSVSVPIKS